MNDPTKPAAGTSSDPVTGLAPEPPESHLIQQAEVPPLDVDGVQAAVVGTVLFGAASVILALLYARLAAIGDGWWLGVALSGFGLGVLGLGYTFNRRRRRRRSGRSQSTS